jgi:cellulose synthase/poly-beta-1,6-N-acetylglucosamine synthase-like glycosyltransferase
MKVSFIIPVLNEEKNIANCLESVSRQDFPKKDVEVVLIDAMSNDRTVELARGWSKKSAFAIKVVENPHHRRVREVRGREGASATTLSARRDIEIVRATGSLPRSSLSSFPELSVRVLLP